MRGLVSGLCLLVTLLAALAARAGQVGAEPSAPDGHLLLLVEGDAQALFVTTIVAKSESWSERSERSDTQVLVRDAEGKVLGQYPLDLSHFDLDPARVGMRARVDGCVVKETKVSIICSVPRWKEARVLEIRSGERLLGSVGAQRYAELVAAGVR